MGKVYKTLTIYYQDATSAKYKSVDFDLVKIGCSYVAMLQRLLSWGLLLMQDDGPDEIIVPNRVTGVVLE